MKIIFSGGRNYENRKLIYHYLEIFSPEMVIVGDCPTGLDDIINEYCNEVVPFCDVSPGVMHKTYYADWNRHGKAAGPKRNRLMCEENKDADFLLAFPGGRGTEDCIRHAKEFGIPVLRVDG